VLKNKQTREQLAYWILVSLNVLIPAVEIVGYVLYNTALILQGEASKFIAQILNAANMMVYMIEIVSGVLLLHGVCMIRKTIR